MQYPHRKYIKYLLTKRLTPFEIRASCEALMLESPDDPYLEEVNRSIGVFPECWRAEVTRGNTTFRKWLKDQGVLECWSSTKDMQTAMRMLHQDSLRTDFEAILLVHGDVEQAHGELSVKYPKQIMPSLNALQVYYDYFWNLGSMGPGELYAFIEQRENNHFHAPAVRGEIVRTYSQLGLQQRITHEKLLQEIVEFGYAAAQKGRRQIDQLGAQMISSLATTALAGAKASEMLQETRLASEGDVSMRQEATDFLAKRIKQPFIPSIDVLDDGVIDVEFEDVDRS